MTRFFAFLCWLGGAVVAAGLAHGVFWLGAVHRLDAQVAEQAQALREQGWRVVLGPARPQGWPGRAGLRFGSASVEGSEFAWRAEGAAIDVPLRWPEAMAESAPGPARLRADGQQVRLGADPPFAVAARDWQLEASGGVTLTGTDVRVASFEAEALQVRLGPEGLALSARRFRPESSARVHGPVVDALTLHASATPPFPFAGASRAAAAAWHGAGGAVDVSDIALAMGRARASGKGRIWLDDALQPRLDGTLHVTGWEAGLDDLAAAGALPRQTVVAAKAVLGLLAAPAPDGGADIPVQVADGVLTVARFPLLRVPALDWPAVPLEP